jgi:AraC-like DNA-binding protein
MPERPSLRYRELASASPLRHAIACYWQIDGRLGAQVQQHRVLPDACADILFDLAAWRTSAAAAAGRIVGTMTRASRVGFSGTLDLIGIRFRPGGAPLVCAQSLAEFTDEAATADLWLGSHTSTLIDQLATLQDFDARVRLLDRHLLAMPRGYPLDRVAVRATQLLAADEGEETRVHAVARRLGLSERQLERRFAVATGLTPAVYRRVLRFRRLLEIRDRIPDWAGAAAEAGYFDQAHMTREFTQFTGVSPRAWSAEQARVGFVQESTVTVR